MSGAGSLEMGRSTQDKTAAGTPLPMVGRRLAAIPPSGTIAVSRKVRELRRQGVDVINLGAGSPEPAPECISKPVLFAPEQNAIGDPAGDVALRSAISDKLARDQALPYDPATQIVVTVGAKQGLYAALLALIDPGDEVAVMDPAWVTYAPSIQIAGGVCKTFPLNRNNGFRLDAKAVLAAIGPRTRAIIINTPHNPTGRVFTESELGSVADLAGEYNLWVISDESFEKFVFDGRRHVSIAAFPGMTERTVILQSFSKNYGLIGARVGYLAAPEAIAAQVSRFGEQVLSCVSPLMQSLALSALAEEPGWTTKLREHYERKREVTVEGVRACPGLTCEIPEGTFYVLADITSCDMPSFDFAMHLLEKARVAVTPGSAFGLNGEGYVRFNLAGSLDLIERGLERIRASLS
jgi:aspartate aminotransferase